MTMRRVVRSQYSLSVEYFFHQGIIRADIFCIILKFPFGYSINTTFNNINKKKGYFIIMILSLDTYPVVSGFWFPTSLRIVSTCESIIAYY